MGWDATEIGQWRMWVHVREQANPLVEDFSSALAIERINTLPEFPETPSGPTTVKCADGPYSYDFGSVYDCDNDTLTREWAINTIDVPPTSGWTEFTSEVVDIDPTGWSIGTIYMYQRVSDGFIAENSFPLHIEMENSPPDPPSGLSGDMAVTCQASGILVRTYVTDPLSDCDVGQDYVRYYGVGTSSDPGSVAVLYDYTGTSFQIDWGDYTHGTWWVHVRDSDEIDWTWGAPLQVNYYNAPPDKPPTPSGPTVVSCLDAPKIYTVGEAEDCDHWQTLTRYWGVNDIPSPPFGSKVEFPSGDTTIQVDWSTYDTGTYYLYQFSDDEEFWAVSDPLEVNVKGAPDTAIFVATSTQGGNDANPGTKDEPVKTISVALEKAQLAGYDGVYVRTGVFLETAPIQLVDGISIYGGCVLPCWDQDPTQRSSVTGANPMVIGNGIESDTLISQMVFWPFAGNAPNKTSIAAVLIGCSNDLVFEYCEFNGNNGAHGADGGYGSSGADGVNGQLGHPGCQDGGGVVCGSCAEPTVGAGGIVFCGTYGGDGGRPVKYGYAYDGEPGWGGTPGGPGGEGDGDNGKGGGNGSPGSNGSHGLGGNGIGYHSGSNWFGSSGQNGAMGSHGRGGGGGGGGAGWYDGLSACYYYGGSGGGGGSGGCGGDGGQGGAGGGGSIGVFMNSSEAIFTYCHFSSHVGGNGGAGAPLGLGGWGYFGSLGGPGYGGSGGGGAGGWGGDGGDGGLGGGGGGGISYCIYRANGSNPTLEICTFNHGKGGYGGGAPSLGNPGDNGEEGDIF